MIIIIIIIIITTVLSRHTTWANGHSSVYFFKLISGFLALGVGDALGTKKNNNTVPSGRNIGGAGALNSQSTGRGYDLTELFTFA